MRILVIEDDPGMAGFLHKGLREAAYAVDLTASRRISPVAPPVSRRLSRQGWPDAAAQRPRNDRAIGVAQKAPEPGLTYYDVRLR
jgi:hypothetical protein